MLRQRSIYPYKFDIVVVQLLKRDVHHSNKLKIDDSLVLFGHLKNMKQNLVDFGTGDIGFFEAMEKTVEFELF